MQSNNWHTYNSSRHKYKILVNSAVSEEYLNILAQHDFESGVNEPIRDTTCLDLVIIKQKSECNFDPQAVILETKITNHSLKN